MARPAHTAINISGVLNRATFVLTPQAQAARGRALELAMRLDMAVALMRSNELGGVAGMGPLPPLGPLAPGSVVTGGSLATSTAPSAAGGVSMGGGHGLGAAPPSPPVSSGGFSHRG